MNGAGSGSSSTALAIAPLLLVGLAIPPDSGWLLTVGLLAGAGVFLRFASPRPVPPGGPATRLATVLVTLALAGAIAAALGELLARQPATFWALPVVLVAALAAAPRRPLGPVLAAVLVPLAGAAGVGVEAEGRQAHGAAYSGPIAGIHPFQSTAVIIDGHGPFDIPINDYVEPDGSRGYGPVELAAALERTLHAIADLHFSQGPARARLAFAAAEVDVAPAPRLPGEETDRPSTGLVVRSGTHGTRSSVELVCPGQVLDPRPRRPHPVLRDDCPDKYASEGSAGLGVTGRWPGYTEIRGQAQLRPGRLFGWARPDEGEGGLTGRREAWLWSGLCVLAAGLATRRLRAGVAAVAAAQVWTWLWLSAAALVACVQAPAFAAVEPTRAALWPAGATTLALLAGALWARRDPEPAPGRPRPVYRGAVPEQTGISRVVGVAAVALGSAWVLGSPAAAVASAGVHGPADAVEVAADALALRTGLPVLALEGALGAVVVAVLFGALIALLPSGTGRGRAGVVSVAAAGLTVVGLSVLGLPRAVLLGVLGLCLALGLLEWARGRRRRTLDSTA